MTRSWIAILWFLVVAVIALAAFAPASWLDRRLGSATDSKIRLNDAEGTIWRGRGTLSDGRGTWKIPIAWQFAPWPLLRGALDVELTSPSDADAPRGRLRFEESSVDLRGLRVRTPAAVLHSAVPIKLPAEFGGEFVIDAPTFRYRANQADGTFDVRWERARLATNGAALDLGTVTARVTPQGAGLAGKIANVGGDARIDGDVAFSSNGVTVRADIVPAPSLSAEMARMLSTLGTPDANGVLHMQWSARH